MFEKIENKQLDKSWATITKDGFICLNRNAQREVELDKYTRATVFYDRVEKRIGLKLRTKNIRGDYCISKNSTNKKICIKKMMRDECIRHRGRFAITSRDGLVIIHLKEKII